MDDICVFSKGVAPAAPPLPGPATRNHQKGPVTNGSPLRGCNCVSTAAKNLWERLFDSGYKADVTIYTDYGGIIYAHANILGMVSPIMKGMLKQSKIRGGRRSLSIRGVPLDALLELHSRLFADSDVCRVPLCRNFKEKLKNQSKRDEIKWRKLVEKILRTRSIGGAPFSSWALTNLS